VQAVEGFDYYLLDGYFFKTDFLDPMQFFKTLSLFCYFSQFYEAISL
jgi:hypothetical protein